MLTPEQEQNQEGHFDRALPFLTEADRDADG